MTSAHPCEHKVVWKNLALILALAGMFASAPVHARSGARPTSPASSQTTPAERCPA